MDELKVIFASNLIRLRTGAGMTQAELGEFLHYSDKSVSKWERGEAIPDAFVLKRLSERFSVTVDSLLTENSGWVAPEAEEKSPVTYSRTFIILCAVAGIWAVCILEFVLMWVFFGSIHWIIFPLAVPLSLVTILVFNSVWYHGRRNMYIIGLLVLSLVLLTVLALREWRFLVLLVPAELLVFLACHIRPRKRPDMAKNR